MFLSADVQRVSIFLSSEPHVESGPEDFRVLPENNSRNKSEGKKIIANLLNLNKQLRYQFGELPGSFY